jgi:hypothetical protein
MQEFSRMHLRKGHQEGLDHLTEKWNHSKTVLPGEGLSSSEMRSAAHRAGQSGVMVFLSVLYR